MISRSAKELQVYRKAYALAQRIFEQRIFEQRIFELSKKFPSEERYALTGQIRRSSRSICMNRREAWAKRRYPAHFVSKLTDCDGENGETDTSLDFAKDCGYISPQEHQNLVAQCEEVGRMLGSLIQYPDPFLCAPKSDL